MSQNQFDILKLGKEWATPILSLFVVTVSQLEKLQSYFDKLGARIFTVTATVVLAYWTYHVFTAKVPGRLDPDYTTPRFKKEHKIVTTAIFVVAIILCVYIFYPVSKAVNIVFLPGDLEIRLPALPETPALRAPFTVLVQVEIVSGEVTLVRKAEIVKQKFEREYFPSDLAPELKIVRVWPSNPTIGQERRFSTIQIDFDTSTLVPDWKSRKEYKDAGGEKVGEFTIRLFYKVGAEERWKDEDVPMYFVR